MILQLVSLSLLCLIPIQAQVNCPPGFFRQGGGQCCESTHVFGTCCDGCLARTGSFVARDRLTVDGQNFGETSSAVEVYLEKTSDPVTVIQAADPSWQSRTLIFGYIPAGGIESTSYYVKVAVGGQLSVVNGIATISKASTNTTIVNSRPVTSNASFTTPENIPLLLQLSASDSDNDVLTFLLDSQL